jgi:hypothetical protein
MVCDGPSVTTTLPSIALTLASASGMNTLQHRSPPVSPSLCYFLATVSGGPPAIWVEVLVCAAIARLDNYL